MTTAYNRAVEALYRAPHESFVSERQRLAAELKGAGDPPHAARLAKLGRPTLSAWAVNQLWWHARREFDELFETAEQLRRGKHAASAAHRQVLNKLTTRAKQLLEASQHGATDPTLRRITMTLSGLAATGSFDPELPGALVKDRDPPGFEAFGISATSEPEAEPDETPSAKKSATAESKRHDAAMAKRAREEAEAERRRAAEERAERAAKRREAESSVREAKAALEKHEHDRSRIEKELAATEREIERAQTAVEAAETRLAALESAD